MFKEFFSHVEWQGVTVGAVGLVVVVFLLYWAFMTWLANQNWS